jgi:peptidoglycan hydrolase-like protein with peptidoglycan-binding domain
MENTSEIVAGLQELQNQVKYFHWQTKSYAQHQALAKVFDSITELIDTFVETLMGKYGRPSTKGQKFEMFDLEDVNIEEWTGGVCDLLISFSDVLDDVQDTDLLNLRDEMLQNFNQLKYLLTLKENMNKKKVIKLSENDLYRIVKRVINEQASDSNRKKSIQCFLSKKGLYKGEIDGLMGEKTEMAVEKYQVNAKVYPSDGVWGPETEKKMNDADKKIFKSCQDQYGDMMDKIVGGVSKFFGLED